MSSQTTTQIILNKDKDKCKMSFILVFGIFNMCVTSTLGIQNLSNKTMSQDANDNTGEARRLSSFPSLPSVLLLAPHSVLEIRVPTISQTVMPTNSLTRGTFLIPAKAGCLVTRVV